MCVTSVGVVFVRNRLGFDSELYESVAVILNPPGDHVLALSLNLLGEKEEGERALVWYFLLAKENLVENRVSVIFSASGTSG